MGWNPWSSGDSNKNAASDGGRIAPDRTSRARCWEGRDSFFACLDKNDILDGIKDDKKARQKCANEVAEFEAACSQSWVRTVGSIFGCLLRIASFWCFLACSTLYLFIRRLLTRYFWRLLGEIFQGKACDGVQPGQDD